MRNIPRPVALRIIYVNAVLAVLVVSIAGALHLRRVHRFDAIIVSIARDRWLDPRFVSAVIWKESRYDAGCVGTKGEIGLMQVTEGAATEWSRAERIRPFGMHDLFNPATNVAAGTWYLARAVRRWGHASDPLPLALAEYNAGHANAVRWAAAGGTNSREFIRNITYPTTKRYVRDILRRYRGVR